MLALGDSIVSTTSTKGVRNWPSWLNFLLNGAFQPTVSASQGVGGNTMAQVLARVPFSVGQTPQVVLGMWGHNDGFAAGTLSARIASNRAILNALRAGLPNAVIIWFGTLPSTVGGEDPAVLAAFNADGGSWCQQDGKAIYVPVPPGWDPTIGVDTEDGTHPNLTGALLIATYGASIISPFMVAGNPLLQTAATGTLGPNLDTEYSLPGTGGTKTGTVTPTGNVATGKEVTNNLTNGTSVGVACSKGTIGADATQIIDITGTPAAQASVIWDEAAATPISITGLAGQFYEYLIGENLTAGDGVSAPTGLRDMVSTCGSLGTFMSISTTANTANLAQVVRGAIRTWPVVLQVPTSTVIPTATVQPTTVVTDLRVTLYQSICRQIEVSAYAAPFYCGDDGLTLPAGTVRITGTATVASVLTASPGTWAGGGMWETHGLTYQWNQYTSLDVLVGPIVGATSRTYTVQAGDTGFKIGLTVSVTNDFGASSKDSALTAVVT